MPPTQTITFYIFFFIVVVIIAFPRFVLSKLPKVTGEEISSLRPNLRAIKFQYNIMVWIGCPIYTILLIAAGVQLERPAFNEFFLFLAGLLFLGAWDGLFAATTGVFPAISRWNFDQFVYAPQEKYRKMARWQIGLAVLGTVIYLALYYFYPG